MYIDIIISHPNPDSFCHALLNSFVEGAKTANHDVHIIDLYKDNFNPIISLEEAKGEISDPIIKQYQKQIKDADCLYISHFLVQSTCYFRRLDRSGVFS